MGDKLGFTLVEVERGRVVFEGTADFCGPDATPGRRP